MLYGCCGCSQIGFIRLTSYENDYWQTTIIMHSSCSTVYDTYLCGMYSACFLQDVEVVCVGLHKLGTWCGKKDVFLHWTYLFGFKYDFTNGLSIIHFWSVWPLSVVPHPCSMWKSCAQSFIFHAPCAHYVFVGPGFESQILQGNLFIGPRFDYQAPSPVSDQ